MNQPKTYENYISFPMQCVRHLLAGESVEAYVLVNGSNGYGMAACAEHREVTHKVITDMRVDDDHQTKALFALHGAPVDEPETESSGDS